MAAQTRFLVLVIADVFLHEGSRYWGKVLTYFGVGRMYLGLTP